MSFKCVNEMDHFSFDECQIVSIKKEPAGLLLEVEALIVLPKNSQNTNYTKSFAATTMIRIEGAQITAIYKEGFKRYDALDRLVEVVADEPVDCVDPKTLFALFENAYLYRMDEVEDGKLYLGVEITKEGDLQGIESDIYRLEVSFEKVIFNWERFLNRVQE